MLELLDNIDDLKTATKVTIDADKILSFQNTIAKPFVADLKANITSRFASSNAVVSALSIFDPRKVPKQDSVSLPTYGEESVGKLIAHYGEDREAETVDGEETVKAAMISTEIRTEWKTFRQLLVKQPQDTTASQLKELVSNDMLKAMFPNLEQDCLHWLDDSRFHSFSGKKLFSNEDDKDSVTQFLERLQPLSFNENCYRGTRSTL